MTDQHAEIALLREDVEYLVAQCWPNHHVRSTAEPEMCAECDQGWPCAVERAKRALDG